MTNIKGRYSHKVIQQSYVPFDVYLVIFTDISCLKLELKKAEIYFLLSDDCKTLHECFCGIFVIMIFIFIPTEFTIDSGSGLISVIGQLDAEVQLTHTFYVHVSCSFPFTDISEYLVTVTKRQTLGMFSELSNIQYLSFMFYVNSGKNSWKVLLRMPLLKALYKEFY